VTEKGKGKDIICEGIGERREGKVEGRERGEREVKKNLTHYIFVSLRALILSVDRLCTVQLVVCQLHRSSN